MIFEVLCIKHTWCLFVNALFFFFAVCLWILLFLLWMLLFLQSSLPLTRSPPCQMLHSGWKDSALSFSPLMIITTMRQHSTTPPKLLRVSRRRVGAMSLLLRKVCFQTQLGEVCPLLCPRTAAGFRNTRGKRTPPFSLAMWRMCTTTIQQIFPSTLAHAPSWQSTWTTEPKKNPSCILNFHFVLTFHKGMLSTYCHEFC